MVTQATRSTGLDHFENGITLTLDEPNDLNLEMLEFRAPSKSEMNRWLVTLNLHSLTCDNPKAGAAGTLLHTNGALAEGKGNPKRKPVVDVGVSKELMAGWLSLKKDKAGSKKKRYCRLVSATEADGSGDVFQRTTLYATAKLNDPIESGEKIEVRRGGWAGEGKPEFEPETEPEPKPEPEPELEPYPPWGERRAGHARPAEPEPVCGHRQVWRATSVEERQGKNKPKQGGPLEFTLRLPETGSVEIGAEIPAASKSILGCGLLGRGKKSELGQTFSFYAEKDGAAWLEAGRARGARCSSRLKKKR